MRQRHTIAFLLLAAFAVTMAHAMVPHKHIQQSNHQHTHTKAHHHHHHTESSGQDTKTTPNDAFAHFFHTTITGTECAAANPVQPAAAQYFLLIRSPFITIEPGACLLSILPAPGLPILSPPPLAAGRPYFFALKAPPAAQAA